LKVKKVSAAHQKKGRRGEYIYKGGGGIFKEKRKEKDKSLKVRPTGDRSEPGTTKKPALGARKKRERSDSANLRSGDFIVREEEGGEILKHEGKERTKKTEERLSSATFISEE